MFIGLKGVFHCFATRRGPAPKNGRYFVLKNEFLRFLVKGGPIGLTIFLNRDDLFTEDAACFVNFLDREHFSINDALLRDGHGARQGV